MPGSAQFDEHFARALYSAFAVFVILLAVDAGSVVAAVRIFLAGNSQRLAFTQLLAKFACKSAAASWLKFDSQR